MIFGVWLLQADGRRGNVNAKDGGGGSGGGVRLRRSQDVISLRPSVVSHSLQKEPFVPPAPCSVSDGDGGRGAVGGRLRAVRPPQEGPQDQPPQAREPLRGAHQLQGKRVLSSTMIQTLTLRPKTEVKFPEQKPTSLNL